MIVVVMVVWYVLKPLGESNFELVLITSHLEVPWYICM